MSYFPMFVDLEGKHILAVGAGTIGARRILTLLKFGAYVTVAAPESKVLEAMPDQERLIWFREPYETCREQILRENPGFFMVLAAVGKRDTDLLAVSDGRKMGAFVNMASDRTQSDFYFPGIAEAGPVTAGVIAGGENHRLAKQAAAQVRAFLKEQEKTWTEAETVKGDRANEW